MIKTAVVILNWNGKELLEQYLPGVLQYSTNPEVRVYVADNGSTDDSVDYIKKHHTEAEIISLDTNYGFAEGYNKALAQVKASYYVLLNSDVEVTPGWLNPLISLMDKNTSIAACMPKIMDFNQREKFEYAGAAGGFIDKFGYPFCRGRILNEIETDTGQYDDTREIFWATGACMVVRACLYHKAGGLDKDFFAHMEEIDLCWRLKNMGYNIYYSADSVVYHLGGGTLHKTHPRKTYLNFRNNLYLLYKNLPPNQWFFTISRRLFLDFIAAIKFLFSLEPGNFISVFRAHFAFLINFRKFVLKRKQNLQKFTDFYHAQMYKKCIVFDFFLRKKKIFRELQF